MLKNTALRLALLATLTLPFAAHAVDWTRVGADATVTPLSAPWVFTNGLTYASGSSTSSIEAHYNVVDVDGSNTPSWTTFEIGYSGVASGSSISATLYSIDPSTGNRISVCSASAVGLGTGTRTCTVSGLDFSTKTYYAVVILNRNSSGLSPTLNTLRLY